MEWKVKAVFSRALRGYLRVGRGVAGVTGAILGALALSAVIVYPLWALATGNRPVFNLIVLAIVAVAMITAVVRAVLHRRRRGRERLAEAQPRRSRTGLRILGGLAVLVCCYVIAALYWNGILGAAIPATVVLVVVIGYLLGFAPRRIGRDS